VTIRPLGPADAAAFRALRLRGLRESPDAFGGSYEEEAAQPVESTAAMLENAAPGDVVLGAWDEDALLGVVALRREPRHRARHRAGIRAMYVAPEARGRGVGRALLDAVVAHARAVEGIHRLELGVTVTNEAARALYLRAGFIPYGVQPDAYRQDGRSLDSELMTMPLDASR
jgi:RimJ/RimL family protein N-acetyltransferase